MSSISPAASYLSSASGIEPSKPEPPCVAEGFVRHCRQYNEAEWQTKKVLIKQLYMDSNKSLKETMAVMSQEHNFHATRKMYVNHLAAWGFVKNYTKARVSKILHQKRERNAVDKESKSRGEGKWVDSQGIQRYLTRKKKRVETFMSVEAQGTARIDAEVSKLRPPSRDQHQPPQSLPYGDYEHNCPYLQWAWKFRFVEKFLDGSSYEGDSFGSRSYIATDEERPCTQHCFCRQHEVSKAFTFLVQKSTTRIDITIFSKDLYSNIVEVAGLEDLQLTETGQENTFDGLALLKHYHTLRFHLDTLDSEPPHNSSTESLNFEMELLVDGLLADGEIFKSFGYENLYERELLDFKLWKKFQQDKLQRDILRLDKGFWEIDGELEEIYGCSTEFPVDTALQSSIDLQGTKAESFVDAADVFGQLPASPAHTESEYFLSLEIEHVTGQADGCCLFNAVRRGDIAMVQSFLDQGVAVNSSYFLLGEAARAGNIAMAQLLLDRGADADYYGRPLAEAAKAGNSAMVQLFLDRGAAVNGWAHGTSPLTEAAIAGNNAMAQLLLDRGAAVNGSSNADSPLAEAAKEGNIAMAQLLLDRGADADYYGRPLAEAAKAGNSAMVQLFLDRGAAVNGWAHGTSPLTEAARAGNIATAHLLLDRGAAVNFSDYRNSPLTEAAKEGNITMAQLLLDRGAAVNGCGYEDHPLTKAARAGHVAIVQLLLDRGADFRANPYYGSRFLSEDEHNQNASMIQLVQACKEFAFVLAAAKGQIFKLQSLLERGTDVNALTPSGTALSAAIMAGHDSTVLWLLRRGADEHAAAIILQGSCDARSKITKLLKSASQVRDMSARENSRHLHKKFLAQHVLLMKASKEFSGELQELTQRFHGYREAWSAGIRTLRNLCAGEVPGNLGDTMAFLCLAKAISDTLQISGKCDQSNEFFRDLDRWQILFKSKSELKSYRLAIYSMWGVVLDKNVSSRYCDGNLLIQFQELASALVSKADELLGFDAVNDTGLGSSQHKWQLRNGKIPSTAGSPNIIQDLHLPQGSGAAVQQTVHPPAPDPETGPSKKTLRESLALDSSSASIEPVAILLMAGTIFAILVIFLHWLWNISPSCTSISTFSVGINTLQNRLRVLEAYMGVKGYQNVVQSSSLSLGVGMIQPDDYFDFDLYCS